MAIHRYHLQPTIFANHGKIARDFRHVATFADHDRIHGADFVRLVFSPAVDVLIHDASAPGEFLFMRAFFLTLELN